MADKLKAEKIAAARKKLRQFQSKSKTQPNSNIENDSMFGDNTDLIRKNEIDIEQSSNMNFGALDPIQFSDQMEFNNPNQTMHHQSAQLQLNQNVSYAPTPTSNNNPFDLTTAMQQPITSTAQYFANSEQFIPNLTNDNFLNRFTDTNSMNPQNTAFYSSNDMGVIPNHTNNSTIQTHHENSLEQHHHELADLLQIEKLRNHELSVKVTQQHSAIEKLNDEVEQLRGSTTTTNTIEQLQRDLSVHIQTVNILVGEKADLLAKLQRHQQQINEYESSNIELQGRLNASRHRVTELEKDLSTLEKSHQKYDGSQQALCTELETIQEDNKRLKRSHQEAMDETTEVQHQLVLKAKEIEDLKNTLDERNKDLEMTKLRLEQMTAGDLIQSDDSINVDQQQKLDTERQIIELQNMVSELTGDRDRVQQQYQTYVQHLTKETTVLQQRVQELSKSNEKLTKREESLVGHVRDLERQFQKQITTQQRLAALRVDDKSKNDNDTTSIANGADNLTSEEVKVLHEKLIVVEKEKSDLNNLIQDRNNQTLLLQQQLLEKDTKLAELESTLERVRSETPDTANILATIESDKVAASRAVAQNQQLKQQLDEIQKAYVQVSNDKLELASRLQSEQHLAREINHRFADIEQELTSVKEKLHFKDEEMMRLTHENTELNKEILQLSQEVDRLRHYDATTNNEKATVSLQKQLSVSAQEIRRLKSVLKELQTKCDAGTSIGANEIAKLVSEDSLTVTDAATTSEETIVSSSHENALCDSTDDQHQHHHDHHHHDHHHHDHNPHANDEHTNNGEITKLNDSTDAVSVCSTINIATNEAMDKLQERFKRTMNEIADLTEEKQRLEHLVMQLQCETETIGEYIALYQTQRRLLKQRELEKDSQLHRIAADREDMKDKLKQLNSLVELLLIQKGFTNTKQIMDKLNTTNNNSNPTTNTTEENQSTVTTPDTLLNGRDAVDTKSNLHSHSPTNACHEHENDNIVHESHSTAVVVNATTSNTHETATKIINLLTEIKDKNLNQDYTIVPDNLHHCPCCSGKLETV